MTHTLRDRWNPGFAHLDGGSLKFQPETTRGGPTPSPVGDLKVFEDVSAGNIVERSGELARTLHRTWKVLELSTQNGTIHVAAREAALDLISTGSA
ncbi:hypothetical protein BJ994_000450 [Arthrobacter pigmenti]|uniref:Uncharacterized protein n=1 Tax=Arthrobacter pigmenti TaxID=271432 RepID=A0A846RM45_9MICC|nr:hypothetical protein [Arthrobacter pigmenti]NJC21374.1 hypothetical protein [Arthrobacter pigmenti]